ncbi:isocitrate dehydrogenase [Candidatus Hakubella thermalkaliphila]|uniref:Isocitrate dehydrogenase n=1 Tax=Candidatus Hakubella thermalkaliphila TaxID=2754717 RepID=A0A6V8Q0Y4_9ACTN|nr:isocitrate/isopropylmalate family dehydrogenase [Candidatus Hakubella thermalkaliphila]GFP37036.1 isocitrate dehydrogenase [Candidatus Hakubella thermalkaliphila]
MWLLELTWGDEIAVFEAVHGSAPKYAGQNRANPTAIILSGYLMLKHLGEGEAAQRLLVAVEDVISDGEHVTRDLGGSATTWKMAEAIVEKLEVNRGA